jgi:hypothetical protein
MSGYEALRAEKHLHAASVDVLPRQIDAKLAEPPLRRSVRDNLWTLFAKNGHDGRSSTAENLVAQIARRRCFHLPQCQAADNTEFRV